MLFLKGLWVILFELKDRFKVNERCIERMIEKVGVACVCISNINLVHFAFLIKHFINNKWEFHKYVSWAKWIRRTLHFTVEKPQLILLHTLMKLIWVGSCFWSSWKYLRQNANYKICPKFSHWSLDNQTKNIGN